MRRAGALFLAVVATVSINACARNSKESSEQASCTPADSIATPSSASLSMGTYSLRFMATTGRRFGSGADGWLVLRDAPDAWRGRSSPDNRYIALGTAKLDVDSIDAIAPGALDSEDARRPGVLVMQSATEGTLLRFGAEANQVDVQRFDGAVMVARVRTMGATRFGGVWISGFGSRMSSGYFCAARVN